MPTPDGFWPTANVLADGPSVLKARDEHLLPGPTIAVNCSLRLEPFIRIDAWATVDAPVVLWDALKTHFKDRMDLITTGNNLQAWESRLELNRILAVEPIYLGSNGVDVVDGRGRKVLMPTIIFVLAYLFRYRDTRRVRVFGADMKGVEGPLHPFKRHQVEDTDHSRARWYAERAAFAQAQRRFRADGRRLERYVVDRPPR
jgi:hypothetical protein